ncbi:MAG: DUF167 domain-containing protein [Puniceicoccales bacterium]|jgi:uncharacterized protein (TIGR00251 family)|nr:DUF167 domain-containing protein [Puniceicoccales bacterium]
MQIEVRVVAGGSRCEVFPLNEEKTSLRVKLTRPALEGRANKQLCEILSKYFGVPQKHVRIVSGEQSRRKRVEITQLFLP